MRCLHSFPAASDTHDVSSRAGRKGFSVVHFRFASRGTGGDAWPMKKIPVVPLLAAALAVFPVLHAEEESGKPSFVEMRTYHAAPGKIDALLKRFEDHTLALFEKHGMTNVGYWRPVEVAADSKEQLVFLLSYPDKEAREASWQAFGSDPDWIAARDASEVDGKLVEKVDQWFLEPTDFSFPFTAAPEGVTRLFELRTYTTVDGRLDALLARFRDHTTKLFGKHGMTNMGYFTPVEGQPGAGNTLVYFLAHDEVKAAEASFTSFRADPVWVAARAASEEAAGGSLTVPDGVKSRYLVATGFSAVR